MSTSRAIIAALFLLSLSPAVATPSLAADGASITITRADIAAYKAALRLTAMQQVYWVPVAAALKSLPADGQTFIVDIQTFSRLRPVLRPLFASFDDEQKQIAMAMAQRLGLMQFASLM
jgi:hypothetical protein